MRIKSTQILLLTHHDSKQVQIELDKLRSDLGPSFYCKVLFYQTVKKEVPVNIRSEDVILIDSSILTSLGYRALQEGKLVPGSNHFPLFKFALEEDFAHDYYWMIEDDVRFTGNWKTFFDDVHSNDADYITSHVHRCPMEEKKLFNSFNPIYRLSSRALRMLHHKFKNERICGHHEQTFVNLCLKEGLSVMDFGGSSSFTPPHLKEKYYRNRYGGEVFDEVITHRFRPVFKEVGKIPNKIYHPVKNFSL